MSIFKCILHILTILYGSLTILGGATGLKHKKIQLLSALSMIVAGLIIILIPFISVNTKIIGIVLLILSLLAIHISAVCNGIKMHGKINVIHHVIRLLISISIIILFILSKFL